MRMTIKMLDHMHQIFLSCMSFRRKRKGYNMYWLSYTRFEFLSFERCSINLIISVVVACFFHVKLTNVRPINLLRLKIKTCIESKFKVKEA